MNLKNLMVDMKSTWIEYPGLEGFEINVAHLGREKVMSIRKSCMESKFDRKTRQPYEELNDKKFVRKFTDATVLEWKGLKLPYLEQLMLVDISSEDPSTELPYNQENAELLVSNSTDFDQWLNEAVHDLENFRTDRDGKSVDTTGPVAE